MRSQALGDNKAIEYMRGRKVLEINPSSPIIRDLQARSASSPGDGAASEAVQLMYETALLTSGFNVESPADFAGRIFALMESKMASAPYGEGGAAPRGPAQVVTAEVVTDDPWQKSL